MKTLAHKIADLIIADEGWKHRYQDAYDLANLKILELPEMKAIQVQAEVIKKNADGVAQCPYCGGLDYKLIKKHRVAGHGDCGTESFLKCENCKAMTTFEGYYDQWNKEKYNKRY